MKRRIIIAGGGTGGHIFPAIAIADALKKENLETEILFVGANGKMEMEKVPEAGYKINGLDIAGFNRSSLIKNIDLPMKLIRSFLQVKRIINDFKPDAAVGVGGYSSFPVLRYAQLRRIPTFIHESNSFAGRSNILLGKKATKIFVATDGMSRFFPAEKIVITGNPVRPDIVHAPLISKKEALDFFGLSEEKITVLALGGSLGARSINEAMHQHLDDLKKNNLQLIWQTGKTQAEKWKANKAYKNIWVGDFITQMEYAYAAADIVVSRSGAMAVAELCVVKKPVLFIPYPFAAEDHQTANAKKLVDKQAALIIKDSAAINEIVPALIALASDSEKQQMLKENIGKESINDADKKIARAIMQNLKTT
jgi:UDP-N-acetylglucosamine--N-acetylmuramyl-(pentapeptide) pyrophosphoryl-undecaprenol N-acetylglucosamine transferase